MVGAAEAGTGEPDDGLPHPRAPHYDRRAVPRGRRLRGEAGRGRYCPACLVADLGVSTGPRCQVQHRGQVSRCPAVAPVPRRGRGHRDRARQLRALPGRQGRDVRGGERRGQPGEHRDRRQRNPQGTPVPASGRARCYEVRGPAARRHRQSSRARPSRYPPPRMVCTIRGLPGSSSILRRRFFTCESTVRS